MDKKYIVLLVLVCGILGGGLFVIRGTMDRVAPEIQLPEVQAEYNLSDTNEVLLKGVTAMDNKDGDVTDSLVVENVFTDDEKGTATVVYVAKDSSNNVTKATRYMTWNPENVQTEEVTEEVTEAPETEPKTEKQTEAETEEKSSEDSSEDSSDETELQTENTLSVSEMMHAAQTEEQTEEQTDVQTDAQTEAPAADIPEEDLDAYYEEIFAELSPEVPRLRLTNRKLEISVGDTFDPLIYVQSIVDDYDNKYELWRHISIEGEVNTKVPGIYQLIYTATDSSGNSSNRAMLLVDVQGEYDDETEE